MSLIDVKCNSLSTGLFISDSFYQQVKVTVVLLGHRISFHLLYSNNVRITSIFKKQHLILISETIPVGFVSYSYRYFKYFFQAFHDGPNSNVFRDMFLSGVMLSSSVFFFKTRPSSHETEPIHPS